METIIENKTFIYHLFKHSQKNWMEFDFFYEFLEFLYKELSKREILKNYRIWYDMSLRGLEYTVSYNPDLDFDLDNRIYLKKSNSLEKLLERYPIDSVIESIISEYCFEKGPQTRCCMENQTNIQLLARPEITTSCGEIFNVNAEDCFLGENGMYYQLCPHCGFISYIPDSKLSLEEQEKVKIKGENDPYLVRKMILFSELKKLDECTTEGKKILKK